MVLISFSKRQRNHFQSKSIHSTSCFSLFTHSNLKTIIWSLKLSLQILGGAMAPLFTPQTNPMCSLLLHLIIVHPIIPVCSSFFVLFFLRYIFTPETEASLHPEPPQSSCSAHYNPISRRTAKRPATSNHSV